jgi:ketosteroid isomerase-like protein
VVTRYVDAVAAGHRVTMEASVAENLVWTYPGDLPPSGDWRGRDAVLNEFLGAMGGQLFDTAAPLVIRLTNVIADGDQVFAEWTTRPPRSPAAPTPTTAARSSPSGTG